MLFYSVGTFKCPIINFLRKKTFFLINNVSNKNQSKKVANSVIDMPWVGKG